MRCLERRAHTDIAPCERSRDDRRAREIRARDKLQRAAARSVGALYRTTRDITCPNDPCPFVVDGILMTRDGRHLTATYARSVWRAFMRMLPDV